MIKKLNIPAALVALLSVCWNAPASAQATKVAIGYSGISADQLVIWVAKDTGIFAKNNLDAQLIYFTGGTLSVTAMVSGDTPLIQASGPGIVSAGLAGADPVYVVGGIVSLDYWLMTQPEIKTPEQLKGGTIAVARFGGAADFVARYALARLGLNPGKDVTIVQTGSTPERLAAMEGAARFGQHSSSTGDLRRAKKRLSSLGRCRRSRPRLSASRRGDNAKIFTRASGRGAKFR
jgi:ABC-type nitrate/sulfonate/bicarbonate transport system substrate-binding protein